jgi:hypothetical protein
VPVALVVALVVVVVTAFLVSRPASKRVRTVAPASSTAATPNDIQVQFTGASGDQLSGDLLLAARSAAPSPGVVIIPDWGAVDRDGMTPPGELPDPLYADLAHSLASRGVASLRYDPPGQGLSSVHPRTPLSFQDLVDDADAALHLLAQRVEIDPHRLVVIGDGWGGLAALQLAAQNPMVSRLVLVSTPGRPVADTIATELLATAVTPADGQEAVGQLRAAVTTLLAGGSLPDPASLETALRPFLQKADETYLRAVFGLAPATLAGQVHVPTLIVRGGQDPALTEADTDLLAVAVGSRSQVLLAPDAGATLTITTRTDASAPTTVATLPGGMQSMRQPTVVVTISRDVATLSNITGWVTSTSTG